MMIQITSYIGVMACGIQGARKAGRLTPLCLLASFFAALGGGMLRDLFILSVFPVALTRSCVPDIVIALCAGILSHIFFSQKTHTEILEQFTLIADAIGVGTFTALGINKALALGFSYSTALICGMTTALGGGILSSLLCGSSIRNLLMTGTGYRAMTATGAALYICCLYSNVDRTAAQYCLTLYTIFFIPLSSYKFTPVPTTRREAATLRYSAMPAISIIQYRIDTHCVYLPHAMHPYPSSKTKKPPKSRGSAFLTFPKYRFPHRFSRNR